MSLGALKCRIDGVFRAHVWHWAGTQDVTPNFTWPDGYLMPLPRPLSCQAIRTLRKLLIKHSWDQVSFQIYLVQFSRSVVSDSATPWTAARQGSLSITNSQSLLKLMSDLSNEP